MHYFEISSATKGFKFEHTDGSSGEVQIVSFLGFYDSGKSLQNLHSRNNNFLELRLLAATCVAVSHSSYFFFPNFLPRYFHLLSDNSVFAFFLISGFLITKSARSRSVKQFLINRVRRVFPALILNLIAISFIFAPLISRSTQKHLQVSDQFLYFIKGLTLVPSWQISIGDSLSFSKVSAGWNNPLWTVGIEVMCYFSIIVIVKCSAKLIPSLTTILLCCALLMNLAGFDSGSLASTYIHYLFIFLLGGFASLDLKPREIYAFLILIFAVVFGTQSYGLLWYPVMLFLTLIIAAADIPKKLISENEYSYGIYLWHWPVLQLITNLDIGANGLVQYLLFIGMTILFAMGSWHYLEKSFLVRETKSIS